MSSQFERYRGQSQLNRKAMEPVEITDIMVAPNTYLSTWGNYLGEYNTPTPNDNKATINNDVQRIGDHIALFAKMADDEHKKANQKLSGEWEPNKVTRLSFNEFSFFTKDQPLTPEQYRELIQRITAIAENCSENLHLVLASFAVKYPDGGVYNIVVHAQCGKPPKLHPFAKSIPSGIDAIYPGTTNPSFLGPSYYPKVLNADIEYTSSGFFPDQIAYKDIAAHISNPLEVDKTEILAALKAALLADKYCPPPQTLVDAIDACATDLTTSVPLSAAHLDQLKEQMESFATNATKNYLRRVNATKFAPSKPLILSEKITTPHYGQYEFQEIINFIKSCAGDPSKNKQAKELLITVKQHLEKAGTANPGYAAKPSLISHIDDMISNLTTTPLNSLDATAVNKFETEMKAYKTDSEKFYRDENLKFQLPDIFGAGIIVPPSKKIAFNDIMRELGAAGDLPALKAILNAVHKKINNFNTQNAEYTAEYAQLQSALVTVNGGGFPPNPIDLDQLKNALKKYKKDCQLHYAENVKQALPHASAAIGMNIGYSDATGIAAIADSVERNLGDHATLILAQQQLNYLKNEFAFTQKERDESTMHPLLTKIQVISSTIDKLAVANNAQLQLNGIAEIKTLINKKTFDRSIDSGQLEYAKVVHGIQILQGICQQIKAEFPDKDIQAIEDKFAALIDKHYDNQPFEDGDISSFEQGMKELDDLIKALPNEVKILPLKITEIKQAIIDYSKESFADRFENLLKEFNTLQGTNGVHPDALEDKAAQLISMLNKINSIENLPPDCKQAITAVKEKLENGEKIEDGMISDIKGKLAVQQAAVEAMPHWQFPSQLSSQDFTYNASVICETAQGAKFITDVDICLDHGSAIALRSHANTMKQQDMPPLQVSEMVTSNSMGLNRGHVVDTQGKVSHADVVAINKTNRLTLAKTKKITSDALDNTVMGVRDLHTDTVLPVTALDQAKLVDPTAIDARYVTAIDSSDPQQLVVTKPPFGPEVVVRKYNSHQLSAIPLTGGARANTDTFTSNFYVNRLKTIMRTFELPDSANDQKEILDKYAKKFAELKLKPDVKGEEFYKILDKFKNKAAGKEPLLSHIAKLENYMNAKMLSPESYITLRVLNPIPAGSAGKDKAVKDLKDQLQIIASSPPEADGSFKLPVKEIAKAIFDFKLASYALPDSDNADLLKAATEIEAHLSERYSEIADELVKLHETHAETHKDKLSEDFFESRLAKIDAEREALQKDKVAIEQATSASDLASKKGKYADDHQKYGVLFKKIRDMRNEIVDKGKRLEKLGELIPKMKESSAKESEILVEKSELLESENETLSKSIETQQRLEGELSVARERQIELQDEQSDMLRNREQIKAESEEKASSLETLVQSMVQIDQKLNGLIGEIEAGRQFLSANDDEIGNVERQIKPLQQAIEEQKTNIIVIDDQVKSKDEQIQVVSGEKVLLETELADLGTPNQENAEKIAELKLKIQAKNSNLIELKAEKSILEREAISNQENLQSLQSRLEKLEEQFRDLNQQKDKAEGDLDKLMVQQSDSELELGKFKVNESLYQKAIVEFTSKLASINIAIKENESKQSELAVESTAQKGKLDELSEQLAQQQKAVSAIKIEYQQQAELCEASESNIKVHEGEVRQLNEEMPKLLEARREFAEKHKDEIAQFEALDDQVDRHKQQQTTLETSATTLTERIQKLEASKLATQEKQGNMRKL